MTRQWRNGLGHRFRDSEASKALAALERADDLLACLLVGGLARERGLVLG